MNTLISFDVIVLGSGPAGSAAATTASNLGLRVALLDKALFPRDKLCGGLFTGRSEKALRSIFGMEVTPELFLTSNHMRFVASGEVLADIPDAPPVHLTMRRELDAALHQAAVAAGAEPFLGVTAIGFDQPASVITLSTGEMLNYGVLIAADGVNSFVARKMFGQAINPKTIGFGLEIENPICPERDSAVEVDFDGAQWGYGWSFPKSKTATIGVGGVNSRNANLRHSMKTYVERIGADTSLRYKGQYLPFGDYKRKPGRDNVLLVGDAAGLVDPITGEGIALAMESGAMAAQAAHGAIAAQNVHSAFRRYLTQLKPIHSDLNRARIWRIAMFHDASSDYFKRAFAKGGNLQRKYLELLAGEARYKDLQGDLLTRLPKLAWRILKHKLRSKKA